MSLSRPRSLLWSHFTPLNEDSKVTCLYCDQQLAISNKNTCSLIRHLSRKHPEQFELTKKQTQMNQSQIPNKSLHNMEEVIYLVADDPKPPDSPNSKKTLYQDSSREKKLIEQCTEEKIALTNIQKEVMEKELERKTIKVLMLQEEMEHRKHMYELEKQEMERKKQIQEMTKQEMCLKIALLKINLAKENAECIEPNMPSIEIVPTE